MDLLFNHDRLDMEAPSQGGRDIDVDIDVDIGVDIDVDIDTDS